MASAKAQRAEQRDNYYALKRVTWDSPYLNPVTQSCCGITRYGFPEYDKLFMQMWMATAESGHRPNPIKTWQCTPDRCCGKQMSVTCSWGELAKLRANSPLLASMIKPPFDMSEKPPLLRAMCTPKLPCGQWLAEVDLGSAVVRASERYISGASLRGLDWACGEVYLRAVETIREAFEPPSIRTLSWARWIFGEPPVAPAQRFLCLMLMVAMVLLIFLDSGPPTVLQVLSRGTGCMILFALLVYMYAAPIYIAYLWRRYVETGH